MEGPDRGGPPVVGISRANTRGSERADASTWLIALDIDGTVLRADGSISVAVMQEVRRLEAIGHHVMLATGRSFATTRPVMTRLAIESAYLVCSNGAVTMGRTAGGTSYRAVRLETFDPSRVLRAFRERLDDVLFAVEDIDGHYRMTGAFPDATIGPRAELVAFGELLSRRATRVVAMVPEHDVDSFREVARRVGLDDVSHAFGWTAWIDITAAGVTKASALERVRIELGVSRERVMAVGDGRNDVDMVVWAGGLGRGVAMAHSPAELLSVASETAGSVDDDGLAQVLSTIA